MPIWLRKFTFNSIKEHYEEKNKQEKSKSKSTKVQGPDISPTYSTKASTK